jgi:hypothetical protein
MARLPKPSPQMKAATRFFSDYKYVIGYVAAFSTFPALLDILFAIGPPWPHSTSVSMFSSVVALTVLVFAFGVLRHSKKISRLISVSAVGTLISLGIYIFLKAFFVFNAPDWRHQDARGLIVRAEVAASFGPGFGVDDALAGAEFDAYKVYVPWTVDAIRCAMLVSWLLLFLSLSALVSVFVLKQHEDYESQKRRSKSGSRGSAKAGGSKMIADNAKAEPPSTADPAAGNASGVDDDKSDFPADNGPSKQPDGPIESGPALETNQPTDATKHGRG